MAVACLLIVKRCGYGDDGDNDDVMCRVEPMPSQLVIASLVVDRLRHWRFRALRRAAPVNGRSLGIAGFLPHRGSSWRRDDRNPSGRPSWLIAGPRRAIRLLGADRLRGRLVLDASDDLGTLFVKLHRILFERLLLAVFQILALVIL